MKPKTRYNIRLAEKRGVTVRQADPLDGATYAKDIASFQSLLAETADRDEFRTHSPDYYEQMLRSLAVNKSDEMSVRLFLAEHDGQPLAGALVSGFGDMATYLHGASSSEKRELMAPHQLHWQIMLWAKQAGFRKYDFWGVAPEGAAADHPWAGVTRFKLGFGGERKSYVGTWELPGHRFWYAAYRLAKRGR
ncbi:MAG: peptidoglycan bridge formation glycyltransferase FemA/FemB family protein, partial [bacterium]